MDSESSSCLTWFVHLREAANKKWERLRERVCQAFGGNAMCLESTEPNTLDKKAGYSKLVRTNKPRNRLEGGYEPYLPSPHVLTPSDFSIWCTFFPDSTDVARATRAKQYIQNTQTDFSIWCTFFPDSTDVVRATPEEHVKTKTQRPLSIESCKVFPKIPPAVTVSLSVMFPGAAAALSSFCSRQNLPTITPTAGLVCYKVSSYEIAVTAAVIPSIRMSLPRDLSLRSVFTSSVAEPLALMLPVRSTFACGVRVNTPTSMSAARQLFQSAITPLITRSPMHLYAAGFVFASVASPDLTATVNETQALMCKDMSAPVSVVRSSIREPPVHLFAAMSFFASLKSLYQSPPTSAGLTSVRPPNVSESSALMPTASSLSMLLPKIIEFLTMLSEARPMMFTAEQPAMTGSLGYEDFALVPTSVSPYEVVPLARSSSSRPVLPTLMSPVVIASVIITSNLRRPEVTTPSVVITAFSLSGVCLNLQNVTGTESITHKVTRSNREWLHVYSFATNHCNHMMAVCSAHVHPVCTAKHDRMISICSSHGCSTHIAPHLVYFTDVSIDRHPLFISSAHVIIVASVLPPDHRTTLLPVGGQMPMCSGHSMLRLYCAIQMQNRLSSILPSQQRMIAGSGISAQQTNILSMFLRYASHVHGGFSRGKAMTTCTTPEENKKSHMVLFDRGLPVTYQPPQHMVTVTTYEGKMMQMHSAYPSQNHVGFDNATRTGVRQENAIATCGSRFIPMFEENRNHATVESSSYNTRDENTTLLSQEANDSRLPMFSTSEDLITNGIHERAAAVATCGSSLVPHCTETENENEKPHVHTENDDSYIATFLGCSPVADGKECVVECSTDTQPESSECQRLRIAARLQRNREGYDKETFQIFRHNENKYKADHCYLERQSYITSEMRGATISWMAEIADYVEMSHTSLVLSVNFFDRFLSQCLVTKNNLQLVAVTCMFIAGKVEKGDEAAAADDFVYLTAGTYISDQIFGLEKLILKKLQFHMFVPTAAWFCRELLSVCEADEKLKYMTMYLAEMTMLDVSYLSVNPSIIAAASICLARHKLGLPVWTLELWERSHYLPEDLLPCIKCITESRAFYQSTEDQTRQGILRKYSAEKYLEIANTLKYPEQDIPVLEEKCKEFGASEFVSPSRSGSRRWRYLCFGGQYTPLAYKPNTKSRPFYIAKTKRNSFEGYNAETYKIMRDTENKHRADPEYMRRQTDITIGRRQLEVNWMMHIVEMAGYHTSFLLLAVNLMDRFLSRYSVQKEMMKLVAVTCMFSVAKFEVMCYNSIDVWLLTIGHAYTKQQIIGMEKLILTTLDFNLHVPTAAWFCEELLDVCSADDTLRALTKYLVELTTLGTRYLNYRPSQVAAAALCIARYSLGLPPWTKQLLERSVYELEDFLGSLRSLYDDYKLSQDHQGELQSKYRKQRHMAVADFTQYPVPDICRLLELYFKEMDKS